MLFSDCLFIQMLRHQQRTPPDLLSQRPGDFVKLELPPGRVRTSVRVGAMLLIQGKTGLWSEPSPILAYPGKAAERRYPDLRRGRFRAQFHSLARGDSGGGRAR